MLEGNLVQGSCGVIANVRVDCRRSLKAVGLWIGSDSLKSIG